MKGRAHAAKQAYQTAVETGYYSELFARQEKLKALSEYLEPNDVPAVQPAAVLDAMLTMKAHGIPMTIRKVASGSVATPKPREKQDQGDRSEDP